MKPRLGAASSNKSWGFYFSADPLGHVLKSALSIGASESLLAVSIEMILFFLGLISFVAWFFSMLAGGGSPLVLIPLVNVWFGAAAVAPVITMGMLVGNTQRSLFFWKEIDWWVTLWYVPGAIAGGALGAYAFTKIHLEWMQLLIGAALVLMGLNYWFGKRDYQFQTKAWYFLPFGFLYAFGSGLIGSTGPIINPLYLNYGLVKEKMVATKSLNVAVTHVVKILTYLALGAFTKPYLLYGLIIGVAAIPANLLGKWVLSKMSAEQFRQGVMMFIAFSGVLMLWQQRSLLWGW